MPPSCLNDRVSLTIDINGVPPDRIVFAASPLAELTAMLHVLSAPEHHPAFGDWAAATRSALRPDLAGRLAEAEFLWRSSRADFLLPGQPRASLEEELDQVDQLDDAVYVSSALTTTCGADRTTYGLPAAALAAGDGLSREQAASRAPDPAAPHGPQQAQFARQLVDDPPAVRARVRRLLEECGPAFFTAAWRRIGPRIVADLRRKTDLLARRGLAEALGAVSPALSLDRERGRIVLGKVRSDTASAAVGGGVTFVPTVFGSPHLVTVHTPQWRPVVQYPVAAAAVADSAVPMEVVRQRFEALSHPVRMQLVRTLARGAHSVNDLAETWELPAAEVSRHLSVLRKAGLLATRRRGRIVLYELDVSTAAVLGADLIQAVLR